MLSRLDLMGSVQYFIIKYDVTCGIFSGAFIVLSWNSVGFTLNAFYASERIIKYISCILLIWYVTLTIFDGMLNVICISGINLTRGVKFFIYVAYFDFVEYLNGSLFIGILSIVFLCFFPYLPLVSTREVLQHQNELESLLSSIFLEALMKDWYS